MLGVFFLCCCFSTLSALGSILKLQVCNFAEIKRSYENSTGSAEAVDRSPDRSRSRTRSQTRGQLWGIFNLCPALTFAWKSEQWSESPGSGLCDLIAPTVRKCTNAHTKCQFCARRFTRHPNQSCPGHYAAPQSPPESARGWTSGLWPGSLASGRPGSSSSLSLRSANITNNMRKAQKGNTIEGPRAGHCWPANKLFQSMRLSSGHRSHAKGS